MRDPMAASAIQGGAVGLLAAYDLIRENVSPGATLAVFPEGRLLNRITDRRFPLSPGPSPSRVPLLRGERILAEIEKAPPDYLFLNNRPAAEYRLIGFGFDYGERVMSWIQAHYDPVAGYGTVPLRPGKQGGVLLKLRSSRAGRSGEDGSGHPQADEEKTRTGSAGVPTLPSLWKSAAPCRAEGAQRISTSFREKLSFGVSRR